jgi:hypothetical protein
MMTYLDEGYKMQVELMRHQIKAAENQREIDLERMQAQNKGKAKPLFRNYCPMCNINFYGPLTGHRKSDRHRKLKQFLHPECKMCDTLFHTRLEWDDHKLSADHLRKVGEQRRQFNPDLKDDEFELLDVIIIEDEELPVASKDVMLEDKEIKEEEEEEEEVEQEEQVKKESEDTEDNKMETESEEVDKVQVQETSVTKDENGDEADTSTKETLNDTSTIKKEKDEKYNPANVVGRELVVKTGGYVCRLCSMFMKNSEEAELHCQTATHYINFTSITKLHAKINNRKRKMKEEKKENGDVSVNPEETEVEQPEKKARVDEAVDEQPEKQASVDEEEVKDTPVAEQNGTAETVESAEPESMDAEDDDLQEIKTDIPVVEIDEDEAKIDSEELDVAEPESVKEAVPVAKTTPTRGRGGGRGRGSTARRGRSNR